MNYQEFSNLVETSKTISCSFEMQPVGGPDATIAPPTYAKEDYEPAIKKYPFSGKIDDSHYAHAMIANEGKEGNALEEALSEVNKQYDLFPTITVKFDESRKDFTCDTLDLAGRVFDPRLRDSTIDDVDFLKSEIGKAIIEATEKNVEGLLKYAPYTFVFGAWSNFHTRVRIPRALAARIDAQEVSLVRCGSTKFDSWHIPSSIEIKVTSSNFDWEFGGDEKPSEVHYGSVASRVDITGIQAKKIMYRSSIALGAFRRLRLTDGTEQQHVAMRAYLAALATIALKARLERDFFLRSGCDLIPVDTPAINFMRSVNDVTPIDMSIEALAEIANEAKRILGESGITIHVGDIELTPMDKLNKLVDKAKEDFIKSARERKEEQE